MTQRRKTSPKPSPEPSAKPAGKAGAPGPLGAPGDDEPLDTSDLGDRVFLRPDGYYWLAIDGKQEVGPFDTHAEAMADMDSGEAGGWAPGETLAEAESELGLTDWIDADSGGLAEGPSRTRIERE